MANLTAGIPVFPYSKGFRQAILPQEASQQLWQGGMVSCAADGGLVPATTSGAGHVVGVSSYDQLDATGVTGQSRMQIYTDGIFIFSVGVNAPSDLTPFGTVLYAETDNTVGTGAGGETTIAGRFFGFTDDGRVLVYISTEASWFDSNLSYLSAGSSSYKARAVMTSLAAYAGSTTGNLTASANGALAAQDGVTIAVGDVVFIQAGTSNLSAASDSGPYVVTGLGSSSSKWTMQRPSWWATGSALVPGQSIDIGGEGTTWGGSAWRSFAAKGSVVDTTDPALYVRTLTQSVTLVTGFVTKTNVGIRSTSESMISFMPTNFSGAGSTISYRTGAYTSGGAATAAGYAGTASVSITALVAAGTYNTSDVSSGLLTITNW